MSTGTGELDGAVAIVTVIVMNLTGERRGVRSRLQSSGAMSDAVAATETRVLVIEAEDFFEIGDDRWHEYFEANLMTGVRITRSVLRDMLDRDSGSVVFIASEAALRSLPPVP